MQFAKSLSLLFGMAFAAQAQAYQTYVLVEDFFSDEIVISNDAEGIVTGRPSSASITPTALFPGCGTYLFEGADVVQSAIFPSGTTLQSAYVILAHSDYTKDKQTVVYFVGGVPPRGSRITNAQLFREDASDSGTCVQEGRHFQKMQVTID